MQHSLNKPHFNNIKITDKFAPIINDSTDLDLIDDVKESMQKLKYMNNPFDELSVDDRIQIERNMEIKQIEQDMIDLNEIMQQINLMVCDQGIILDEVEQHVETAALNIEIGVNELKKAEQHQINTRRTTVATISGAVIGGVALGGFGGILAGITPGLIGGGIGSAGGAITGYISQ